MLNDATLLSSRGLASVRVLLGVRVALLGMQVNLLGSRGLASVRVLLRVRVTMLRVRVNLLGVRVYLLGMRVYLVRVRRVGLMMNGSLAAQMSGLFYGIVNINLNVNFRDA
jgi:hypothetical protein